MQSGLASPNTAIVSEIFDLPQRLKPKALGLNPLKDVEPHYTWRLAMSPS
jgi:hypothetical protein